MSFIYKRCIALVCRNTIIIDYFVHLCGAINIRLFNSKDTNRTIRNKTIITINMQWEKNTNKRRTLKYIITVSQWAENIGFHTKFDLLYLPLNREQSLWCTVNWKKYDLIWLKNFSDYFYALLYRMLICLTVVFHFKLHIAFARWLCCNLHNKSKHTFCIPVPIPKHPLVSFRFLLVIS